MSIVVKDFIFCDDIRNEEGRKFSLMGIYADKLKITPKNKGAESIQKFRIPISLFIRFKALLKEHNQEYRFTIEVDFEKTSIAKIEGTIHFQEESLATLPLARIEYGFEKSGNLNFKLTMKDTNENLVLNHEEALKITIENPKGQP